MFLCLVKEHVGLGLVKNLIQYEKLVVGLGLGLGLVETYFCLLKS